MTAPFAEWTWSAKTGEFSVKLSPGSDLAFLRGNWALADFLILLDGLSRKRLERNLKASETVHIACDITLANGRILHLMGRQASNGLKHGWLLPREVSNDLEDADAVHLRAVFQPIIALKTNRIAGFEALARWQDKGGNRTNPKREEQNLATHMLLQACDALHKWRESAAKTDLFIQVNVTAEDFRDPNFIPLITALIEGHTLAPGQLRLELTEHAALRDIEAAIRVAEKLRKAGAALILDDFGTGHSSLLWLARFPAVSVKIDLMLIRQLSDPRVKTILQALPELAHNLDMTITAEGVETFAERDELRAMGYDYAQGYAFAKPMLADHAGDYLLQAELYDEPSSTASDDMA